MSYNVDAMFDIDIPGVTGIVSKKVRGPLRYIFDIPRRSRMGDYTAFTKTPNIWVAPNTAVWIGMTVPDAILVDGVWLDGPTVGFIITQLPRPNSDAGEINQGTFFLTAMGGANKGKYRGGLSKGPYQEYIAIDNEPVGHLPTPNLDVGKTVKDYVFDTCVLGYTMASLGFVDILDPDMVTDKWSSDWKLTRGGPTVNNPGEAVNRHFLIKVYNMSGTPMRLRPTYSVDGVVGANLTLTDGLLSDPTKASVMNDIKVKASRSNSVIRLLRKEEAAEFFPRDHQLASYCRTFDDISTPAESNKPHYVGVSTKGNTVIVKPNTKYFVQFCRGWCGDLSLLEEPTGLVGMNTEAGHILYQRPAQVGDKKGSLHAKVIGDMAGMELEDEMVGDVAVRHLHKLGATHTYQSRFKTTITVTRVPIDPTLMDGHGVILPPNSPYKTVSEFVAANSVAYTIEAGPAGMGGEIRFTRTVSSDPTSPLINVADGGWKYGTVFAATEYYRLNTPWFATWPTKNYHENDHKYRGIILDTSTVIRKLK